MVCVGMHGARAGFTQRRCCLELNRPDGSLNSVCGAPLLYGPYTLHTVHTRGRVWVQQVCGGVGGLFGCWTEGQPVTTIYVCRRPWDGHMISFTQPHLLGTQLHTVRGLCMCAPHTHTTVRSPLGRALSPGPVLALHCPHSRMTHRKPQAGEHTLHVERQLQAATGECGPTLAPSAAPTP